MWMDFSSVNEFTVILKQLRMLDWASEWNPSFGTPHHDYVFLPAMIGLILPKDNYVFFQINTIDCHGFEFRISHTANVK